MLRNKIFNNFRFILTDKGQILQKSKKLILALLDKIGCNNYDKPYIILDQLMRATRILSYFS